MMVRYLSDKRSFIMRTKVPKDEKYTNLVNYQNKNISYQIKNCHLKIIPLNTFQVHEC